MPTPSRYDPDPWQGHLIEKEEGEGEVERERRECEIKGGKNRSRACWQCTENNDIPILITSRTLAVAQVFGDLTSNASHDSSNARVSITWDELHPSETYVLAWHEDGREMGVGERSMIHLTLGRTVVEIRDCAQNSNSMANPHDGLKQLNVIRTSLPCFVPERPHRIQTASGFGGVASVTRYMLGYRVQR